MSSDRLWIVTGATGFLGGAVVRELHRRGERVRALGHDEGRFEALQDVQCERRVIDLTGPPVSIAEQFVTDPGTQATVIHCAGIISLRPGASPQLRAVNVDGTRKVVQACIATRARRLVYVSSIHAVPEPPRGTTITDPAGPEDFAPGRVPAGYAATKAEATRAVLESTGIDQVVVFPTGILGPGDSRAGFLTTLVRDLVERRMPVIVPGGYDFADVRDVASGVIAAALQGERGGCYLLSGEYASIARIARIVAGATGNPTPPVMPMRLAMRMARAAELYARARKRTPLLTRYALHALTSNGEVTSARARAELGYATRPLADTVRDTIAWCQAHPSAPGHG